MRSAVPEACWLLSSLATVSAFTGPATLSRCLTGCVKTSRPRLVNRIQMAEEEETEDYGDAPKVYFASELTEGRTELNKDMEDIYVAKHKDTKATKSDRHGPFNYDGLVDGDTFDGGDGQVGVVGDGSNNMENFDKTEVTNVRVKVKESLVKESKSRQRVAWGSGSTGYAEELKKKGMAKIDKYGEDKMKARRQQLENWRNQQEVSKAQRGKMEEMDQVMGKSSFQSGSNWKRGKAAYFDDIERVTQEGQDESWNKYAAPKTTGKKDGSEWKETALSGKEKIEATLEVIGLMGRPGHASLEVRNTVMTFEPFHCSFIGDTEGFAVNPVEGTLNRRGGEATLLDVQYKGKGPGDNRIGTLVVETEEDKWVYKVEGVMQ